MGCKINRYDPYDAKKVIDGKQCTKCWYINDTKILHVDEKVVSTAIQEIEDRFRKRVVTRGKSHNFVEMNVIFKYNGTVKVMMKIYITK